MAYEVRYSPLAQANRDAIFDYLHERSPNGARNVMASIEDTIGHLANHPHMGEATGKPGLRMILAGRYPYRIFYRVLDGVIEIAHIRHTSRRPWG